MDGPVDLQADINLTFSSFSPSFSARSSAAHAIKTACTITGCARLRVPYFRSRAAQHLTFRRLKRPVSSGGLGMQHGEWKSGRASRCGKPILVHRLAEGEFLALGDKPAAGSRRVQHSGRSTSPALVSAVAEERLPDADLALGGVLLGGAGAERVSPASALKNPVLLHSLVLRLQRCEVTRRTQLRDSLYSPDHSRAKSTNFAATLASSSPFIGSRLDIRCVLSSNPRHNAAQSPCSLAVPQTKPWPLRANRGARSDPFCRRPRPVGLGLLHHGDPTLLVHP